MSAGGFLGLVIASVVIIAVPGPSVMYLIGQALALGRRPAMVAVVGNTTGMAVVAVFVAFGLSALFARYGWVQPSLRVAGALVLAGIGLAYVRSRPTHASPVGDDAAAPLGVASAHTVGDFGNATVDVAPTGRSLTPVRRVLVASSLVGVSNPKALVMFGVVVPSFVAAGTSPSSMLLMAMSAVPLVTGLVLDSIWVFAASAAREWFRSSPGRILAINRAGGVLMLGMAGYMVWEVVAATGAR